MKSSIITAAWKWFGANCERFPAYYKPRTGRDTTIFDVSEIARAAFKAGAMWARREGKE